LSYFKKQSLSTFHLRPFYYLRGNQDTSCYVGWFQVVPQKNIPLHFAYEQLETVFAYMTRAILNFSQLM